MSPDHSRPTVGPTVMVGLLAFLITVSYQTNRVTTRQDADRRAHLASVITTRQQRAAALERRLAELRAEAAAVAARSSAGNLKALQRSTERIAAVSGTTAVAGQGLVVRLADSRADASHSGDTSTRIQDVDIQAVVNALWEAGAEAIAVNGQRLVATSAIRNAGAAVLVNFRVLTSHYRIEAVGDARALHDAFARSDIATHFKRWVEIYGLGFTVERAPSLRLPAFGGSLRFRHAKPIDKKG